MKINIFDYYNDNTKRLINSFETAKISRKNLFVHYDGNLPEKSGNPFTFFMGLEDSNKEGLFFNEVDVPEFYDIKHVSGTDANIETMGHVVGRVNYRKEGFRLVESVDWFLNYDKKNVIKRDFYNIEGYHYASSFYSNDKKYLTEYYKNSETVIIENLNTRKIQLINNSKKIIFNNLTEFFIYYLEKANIAVEDIVINSLAYPLFIAKSMTNIANTTLFWQEPLGENVPGNMVEELNEPMALKQIIFNDKKHLQQVEDKYPSTEIELGYLSDIGEFTRKNIFRKKAFILTSSDRIFGIEDILTTFPDLDITVAAYTNMSTKLEHLGTQYRNLHLIPSLAPKNLESELEKFDIYLDINAGMKVDNILKKAYRHKMLILSLDKVKISDYKSLNFADISSLCNELSNTFSSKSNWIFNLNKMIQQNGETSTISDYQKIMNTN